MSRVRTFVVEFTPRDEVDFRIETERGTVQSFALNYRGRIQGRWREILRYDTAHGHLHVHRFWRRADRVIERLDDDVPGPPYDRQLQLAHEDLRANWRSTRRAFERTHGTKGSRS